MLQACKVKRVCCCDCMTHCVFAGGLHDLAETDADSLPLVALVRAQSLLQDGNNLREDLLSQLPHQITQRPSSDLKARRHTAGVFTVAGKTNSAASRQPGRIKTEWVHKVKRRNTVLLSGQVEARKPSSRVKRVGRISRRVLGVLDTTIFHTWREACRTTS